MIDSAEKLFVVLVVVFVAAIAVAIAAVGIGRGFSLPISAFFTGLGFVIWALRGQAAPARPTTSAPAPAATPAAQARAASQPAPTAVASAAQAVVPKKLSKRERENANRDFARLQDKKAGR